MKSSGFSLEQLRSDSSISFPGLGWHPSNPVGELFIKDLIQRHAKPPPPPELGSTTDASECGAFLEARCSVTPSGSPSLNPARRCFRAIDL